MDALARVLYRIYWVATVGMRQINSPIRASLAAMLDEWRPLPNPSPLLRPIYIKTPVADFELSPSEAPT